MSKIHFYTARYAERFILQSDVATDVALGYPAYLPSVPQRRFFMHTVWADEELELWRLTEAETGCYLAQGLDRADLHGQVAKILQKRTPQQLQEYLELAAIKFKLPAIAAKKGGQSND